MYVTESYTLTMYSLPLSFFSIVHMMIAHLNLRIPVEEYFVHYMNWNMEQNAEFMDVPI